MLSTGQLAHNTSKRSLLEGLFHTLLSLGLCLAPLSHRVPVPAPDVHELPSSVPLRTCSSGNSSCSLQQQSYQSEFCHPSSRPCGVVVPLLVINPRRACAARVTVVVLCVCVSVCLCVYYYSRTTGYEAAYERYQQLQCYKGKKNNVAILLKPLRSGDMA